MKAALWRLKEQIVKDRLSIVAADILADRAAIGVLTSGHQTLFFILS
jgi:hypothetical protein